MTMYGSLPTLIIVYGKVRRRSRLDWCVHNPLGQKYLVYAEAVQKLFDDFLVTTDLWKGRRKGGRRTYCPKTQFSLRTAGLNTGCPRSLAPWYRVTYFKEWTKTSWTYSILKFTIFVHDTWRTSGRRTSWQIFRN